MTIALRRNFQRDNMGSMSEMRARVLQRLQIGRVKEHALLRVNYTRLDEASILFEIGIPWMPDLIQHMIDVAENQLGWEVTVSYTYVRRDYDHKRSLSIGIIGPDGETVVKEVFVEPPRKEKKLSKGQMKLPWA